MNNTQRMHWVALGLAMGLSGVAQAAKISYGDVTAANGFSSSQLLKTIQGVFSDQFFFSVSAPVLGDGFITNSIGTQSMQFDSNGFPLFEVNITDLNVSLYTDGGDIGVVDAGDSYFENFGSSPGAPIVLNPDSFSHSTSLPIGNYYFLVSGDANGIGSPPFPSVINGIYDLNFLVSSVPEPETYAMLLAGFGLVGLAARRRVRVN